MLATDPIALQALRELAVPPSTDLLLIEALADHAWDCAEGEGTDLERIARGQGYTLTADPTLPRGWRGLLLGDELVYRPHRDPYQERVVIAHEVGHCVARRARLRMAHPDIWRLSLAVLARRAVVQQTRALSSPATHAAVLAAHAGVPWWAAAARLEHRPITLVA